MIKVSSVIEIDAILAALVRVPAQPAVLATLVAVEGSSYRRPGARLLVLADGTGVGSISGGCLEEDLRQRTGRVLETGRSETVTYDTTDENDLVWGVGLGCRGVVQIFLELIPSNRPRWLSVLAENRAANRATSLAIVHQNKTGEACGTHLREALPRDTDAGVFFETIAPLPLLVVFGAGDDVKPVVRLARETGWRVVVVDSREGYATPARFPEADSVMVAGAADGSVERVLNNQAYVVVMTHRFAEDVELLAMLLARPLAYLGVLGPRKRTDRVLAELDQKGFVPLPETLERLCAPVGLDLGSTTPETIALSILAELQCLRAGRTPIHLRDRTAPIHG